MTELQRITPGRRLMPREDLRPLRSISFRVPGLPQPQGSTRAFARGGKVVTMSDNEKLRPWRDAVCWHAREAMASPAPIVGEGPFVGPVHLRVHFVLPRPKSHRGTKGALRPSAPIHVAVRPDLDKLIRGVCDALTEAGIWQDDSQVATLSAVKRYGDAPGALVEVAEALL